MGARLGSILYELIENSTTVAEKGGAGDAVNSSPEPSTFIGKDPKNKSEHLNVVYFQIFLSIVLQFGETYSYALCFINLTYNTTAIYTVTQPRSDYFCLVLTS